MALSEGEKNELAEVAEAALDAAESRWSQVKHLISKAEKAVKESAYIPSPFPGIDIIDENEPLVRPFFVLVADMRDSTSHIEDRPPIGSPIETGMQRLYFETSALLPTLAHHIRSRKGRVTEYLGDGLLSFFAVHDSSHSREFADLVRNGDECIEICERIINPLIARRYYLPAMGLGVGLSFGEAIVTTIGASADLRPIAFGLPVFGASKASNGVNQVILAPAIRQRWPRGKGGKRRFREVRLKNGFVGYETWSES